MRRGELQAIRGGPRGPPSHGRRQVVLRRGLRRLRGRRGAVGRLLVRRQRVQRRELLGRGAGRAALEADLLLEGRHPVRGRRRRRQVVVVVVQVVVVDEAGHPQQPEVGPQLVHDELGRRRRALVRAEVELLGEKGREDVELLRVRVMVLEA